jgi:hypothetical protein
MLSTVLVRQRLHSCVIFTRFVYLNELVIIINMSNVCVATVRPDCML